jgi:putative transposase
MAGCRGSLKRRGEPGNGRSEVTAKRRFCRCCGNAESGETAVEICRRHGISQHNFYVWKKNDAGLDLSELRELREEKGKLKRLVADLSLDPHILQEIVAKRL